MISDATDTAERFTRDWVEAQRVVASYIASLVPDFRDAQDLLQKVALVALRKFAEFDHQRSFVSWVLGIARLEVLHHRRNHARSLLHTQESLHQEIAVACEEMSDEFEARARFMTECLGELDGRAATLIRLRYEEALKPAALAQRVGMAAGAVRVALSRIRAALRRCIERKLEEHPI